MTLLSRRCFLCARWSDPEHARQAAQGGLGAHGPATYALPPEFTPALLRAEAVRLGLEADALSESELAGAVGKALRDGAPAPQI